MLKKELEREIELFRLEMKALRDINFLLEKELKIMKEYSPGSHINVMVIALEKIIEAMSHTIQNISSRR